MSRHPVREPIHSPVPVVKINRVEAKKRFDHTEFSNEIVNGMALPIYSHYTCPQCETRIGFQKRDVEETSRERRSNPEPSIQRLFDDYATANSVTERDFLDWLCPSCGLAARVYVRLWAGGNHGDCGASLLTVLEAQSELT